jgi:N-acetylgalactosamine-6-sulfatase
VDETSVLASVDFLPTVCGIVGADASKCECDGEDVGDILTGESRPRRKPIFWEWRGGVTGDRAYYPPKLAVREGKWKLYVNYDGSDSQLYDVVADPSQQHDVAKDNADIASQLAEKVLAWKKTLLP